jgi:hypothetical protein
MPSPSKIQSSDLETLILDEQAEGEQAEDNAGEDRHTKRKQRRKSRRWGTRTEAMAYGRIGSTRLNELMQARKIIAKKNSAKVVIDLDSIDDFYDSLPDAADVAAEYLDARATA